MAKPKINSYASPETGDYQDLRCCQYRLQAKMAAHSGGQILVVADCDANGITTATPINSLTAITYS